LKEKEKEKVKEKEKKSVSFEENDKSEEDGWESNKASNPSNYSQ